MMHIVLPKLAGPLVLVHGGAGFVKPEQRAARVRGCQRAARAGARALASGEGALDAAVRAVVELEANPLFNAGRGACLNADGQIELDASVMRGKDLRAGAVMALPPFEHPILIAKAVLESSGVVALADRGAEAFALANGFLRVTAAALTTAAARSKLERALASGKMQTWTGGTVGAVAIDARGRSAAATSTGGRVGKPPGRVGDSPVPGAGTFADDAVGAVSTTGDGEAMLLCGTARTAIEGLRQGRHASDAARAALAELRDRLRATAGLILVAADGHPVIARTTATMSWALARPGARGASGS